ncbi:hypothetical protein [Streptomyces sp. NPDC048639]|uniref:hypothetical protein n=1 Tax=Streptomyces sp. NPDC048639 TaxID=3365581 RepID=UPI00371C3A66
MTARKEPTALDLVARFEQVHASVRAVLEAAMDARRLGADLDLPRLFLEEAAPGYLDQDVLDDLPTGWFDSALSEALRPGDAGMAPLSHVGGRAPATRADDRGRQRGTEGDVPSGTVGVYRLAESLDQYGTTSRSHLVPPDSFWHASGNHLAPAAALVRIAKAADDRLRLTTAERLFRAALARGNRDALHELAMMRERAGDAQEGGRLLRAAAAGALRGFAAKRYDTGGPGLRQDAGFPPQPPANHGELASASTPAEARERVAPPVAGARDVMADVSAVMSLEHAGDREGAERLALDAADSGSTTPLQFVAHWRRSDDQEEGERLALLALDRGDSTPLHSLAFERAAMRGDAEGAERLAFMAAEQNHPWILHEVARHVRERGDRDRAERLLRAAVDHGATYSLPALAELREEAGDGEEAERFAFQAADQGHHDALGALAAMREKAGDGEGAERLAFQAADQGDDHEALRALAAMREKAGDGEEAEHLAFQTADRGDATALRTLAETREWAGDREAAERLARKAVDHGYPSAMRSLASLRAPSSHLRAIIRFGLEPDGSLSLPAQQS